MKNKIDTALIVCAAALCLAACGGGGSDADGPASEEVVSVEADRVQDGEEEGQETKKQETPSPDGEEQAAEEQENEDEELEEKLAAYRADRESQTGIPMEGGVVSAGAGNPEDFGFSFDASATENFDSEELTAAYGTAQKYVEDMFGVPEETKNTVYMCVDPRIWSIYEAEDKGVANGYAPENIFVCEYCENGTWQYLILVREGKESGWNVIHHGSSYHEEETS